MAVIKDLETVNIDLQQKKERADTADFKMVTFSLAGRDYGIDIMNVKEIAKADKFTFVPNTESFIRGVYNLRGDIIPIIDLRSFFHLDSEKKKDGQENMLILRVDERVYGTIVDKIDKVVGINKSTIQPPHPIFGDINIKFISGVVEKNGDLYVILDVMRIFGTKKQQEEKKASTTPSIPEHIIESALPPSKTVEVPVPRSTPPPPKSVVPAPRPVPVKPSPPPVSVPKVVLSDTTLKAIQDQLKALKHFIAGPLNSTWLKKRGIEWISTRGGTQAPPKDLAEVNEFLSTFDSPCSESFWTDEYVRLVKSTLPNLQSSTIHVWNIGCGKGYESFSLACLLKSRYPNANIKIWANDNDIMSISMAPNMTFDITEIPEYCTPFLAKGKSGYSFIQSLKNSIVFEYHDVLHDNSLPNLDIIVSRDTISYFDLEEQKGLVDSFATHLKKGGFVMVGKNEQLNPGEWKFIGNDNVSLFTPVG
ncbi:MAG: chemotaxis protein CheW [Treponema sp.]|jgi:purine-binding chemotaxis protein CheW|nr:chemotaxis protein CheW [Treponema sp.]